MTSIDLRQAAADARTAALEAWSAICHFHRGSFQIEQKKDGPSTDADKLADQLLVDFLERRYPPDRFGFLSEEFVRDPSRLERRWVWMVDPIDGTSDFIRGSGDFAIQIGLAEESESAWNPVAGVVYHPMAGKLFWSVRGEGAFLDAEWNGERPSEERWWWRKPEAAPRPADTARFHPSQRLHVSETADVLGMVAVVSASHQTKRLLRVLEAVPFQSYYARGSVGVKIAEVAQQHADVYVNTERGRCKEWDLCGPHAILEAAGGTITDLDGKAITYNCEDVRLYGGILASNGRSHQRLVELVSPMTT